MLNLQHTCAVFIHTCHVWLPGDEWHLFGFDLGHILRLRPAGCGCQSDAACGDSGKAPGDDHRKDVPVKMTTKYENTLFYAVN